MTADGVIVRRALPSEAAALASLMARTFSDAFGAANRPEDLATHIARSYSAEIQARELADPDMTVLVADAGGARTLWLGVWEENPRGIAFYRKAGFREVGRFLFHVGDDPQRDLIMVRDLD